MAFVKKTWKDRIVQYANRRLLTKSGGEVEQVTVTRDEGTISEAGDQFNASNMNNLEQRVKDGFDDTKDYIDSVVESGSNANGYYIKYKDGTMICTKTTEFSVAISEWQAWGTCYETALKDCGVWAMNFISNPVVSATQTGGAAWLEYFYDTDNTNVGKTRFVRPTAPGATAIYKMNVIGIGRWKA